MKIRQFYPSWTRLPEPGEKRTLINRQGEKRTGVIYGVLPSLRIALIQIIEDAEMAFWTRRDGISNL